MAKIIRNDLVFIETIDYLSPDEMQKVKEEVVKQILNGGIVFLPKGFSSKVVSRDHIYMEEEKKDKAEEGFSFKLEHPLTEEEKDILTDPEFEHTDSVFYKTPSGKVVEFWKLKFGYWREKNSHTRMCSRCGFEEVMWRTYIYDYCPNCGARMKEEEE